MWFCYLQQGLVQLNYHLLKTYRCFSHFFKTNETNARDTPGPHNGPSTTVDYETPNNASLKMCYLFFCCFYSLADMYQGFLSKHTKNWRRISPSSGVKQLIAFLHRNKNNPQQRPLLEIPRLADSQSKHNTQKGAQIHERQAVSRTWPGRGNPTFLFQ